MQVVCNHRQKIIDLFVGYPGSVHDSRVFRNSPLATNLEQRCGRYHILGDSGYPLKNQLLTPYRDRGNLSPTQINYNLKHARNRYVIEHCFGLLKQKFRQLYHIKLRNIRQIVHFIRAACVIHNIALEDNVDIHEEIILPNVALPQPQADDHEGNQDEDDEADLGTQAYRNRIANMLPM